MAGLSTALNLTEAKNIFREVLEKDRKQSKTPEEADAEMKQLFRATTDF